MIELDFTENPEPHKNSYEDVSQNVNIKLQTINKRATKFKSNNNHKTIKFMKHNTVGDVLIRVMIDEEYVEGLNYTWSLIDQSQNYYYPKQLNICGGNTPSNRVIYNSDDKDPNILYNKLYEYATYSADVSEEHFITMKCFKILDNLFPKMKSTYIKPLLIWSLTKNINSILPYNYYSHKLICKDCKENNFYWNLDFPKKQHKIIPVSTNNSICCIAKFMYFCRMHRYKCMVINNLFPDCTDISTITLSYYMKFIIDSNIETPVTISSTPVTSPQNSKISPYGSSDKLILSSIDWSPILNPLFQSIVSNTSQCRGSIRNFPKY